MSALKLVLVYCRSYDSHRVSHFPHRRAPHRTALDIPAREESLEKPSKSPSRPPSLSFLKRKYQLKSSLYKTLHAFGGMGGGRPKSESYYPERGYSPAHLNPEHRTHRLPSRLAPLLPALSLWMQLKFLHAPIHQ